LNFNILFLLLLISACGVKGDPISPKSPALPSLMENYSDIETEKPIDEFKGRPRRSQKR
jgi:hypothetical protein